MRALLVRPASRLHLLEHALVAVIIAKSFRQAFRLVRREGLRALYKRVAGAVLKLSATAVPGVGALVEAQTAKELAGLEKDLHGDGDPDALTKIPLVGKSIKDVEELTSSLHEAELKKAAGKKWGGIYHSSGGALQEMQGRVWGKYACTNALYPTVFPSLRKFEAEIVEMTLSIVHGRECGAVGLLASGGTEAVLIAALAYREAARRRGIERPTIVASLSAHPAITKACHYFGMDLVHIAPNESMQLTAAAVRPYITGDTVAIYASAPSFSHGRVDAIGELSELALEHKIGLHVDNCLGGYLLSYMQKEGLFNDAFDFVLPGVTSMSVDVHKYGYAPKGSSVVAFRDPELRRGTYVPSSEGCEGLCASQPTRPSNEMFARDVHTRCSHELFT